MSDKAGNILVVDDDEDVLLAARLFLKQHVKLVHTEQDPEKIPTLLKNHDYDVILLDMNYTRDASSGQEGFFWLDKILAMKPSTVVVLITAYGDVDLAVKAIKEGATDFVLKPWQNGKLLATVTSSLRLSMSRMELDTLRSRERQLGEDIDQGFQDFIGNCPALHAVKETIKKVSPTEANILILGENGTGKELVARAIHRQSLRANQTFVGVDMGAISENLFESEMFGHVRGAFTDARADRAGRFEIASGSTLFMDEIGNLSLQNQAKLLTVLQNRQITRVGANAPRHIDIRLICATNMQIHEMVKDKLFRPDLVYRINTVEITMPPLRERIEDLPALAAFFLEMYVEKYKSGPRRLAASTVKKLESYTWPGNIRELQYAVERAVIMSDGPALQPTDFLLTASAQDDGDGMMFDSYNLDDVEKTVIRKVLTTYQGNVSQAAKELGLTRTSLYRRMEKYGL